jgi:curved DNA-binding protein CbpA
MDNKQAMAILGLSHGASFQDAKAAFRRLAKQHHPDHFARDAVAVVQAEK